MKGSADMLNCETNTARMQARVMTAARKFFRQRKDLHAVFEHGQWWMLNTRPDETETYSVNDAEGPGATDGFFFEPLF
jgi:cytosine/adenosine deaminase-related metal-dependent hydrolase